MLDTHAFRTSARRLGAGIAGLALLAPAVALAAGPAGAATTPPRCLAGQMAARLVGAEGAAGSLYVKIQFTNLTAHRCSLAGRPGVSFVAGDDGHQVGLSARRNLAVPVVRVTLAPGGKARAQLRITNQANYPAAACVPRHVRGLRVYPPGSTAAMYIPDPQTACSSSAVRQMTIDPVRPV